ncbi:MAG: hypothetical protein J6J01_09290 [Oscillospiraceae bacterium]|nr:hypothetical protein [Oscillospiraceae bacterium]
MGFEESLTASPLSAEAQGLYTRLLYYANQGRCKTDGGEWVFPEWLTVPQAQLMADLAIKDKHTLYRVRGELLAAGLIETDKAQGRGSAKYHVKVLGQAARSTVSRAPRQGSFDTDDFFAAAVRKSLGD